MALGKECYARALWPLAMSVLGLWVNRPRSWTLSTPSLTFRFSDSWQASTLTTFMATRASLSSYPGLQVYAHQALTYDWQEYLGIPSKGKGLLGPANCR